MLGYVILHKSSTNQSFLMHTGTDFLAFLEQTKTYSRHLVRQEVTELVERNIARNETRFCH